MEVVKEVIIILGFVCVFLYPVVEIIKCKKLSKEIAILKKKMTDNERGKK